MKYALLLGILLFVAACSSAPANEIASAPTVIDTVSVAEDVAELETLENELDDLNSLEEDLDFSDLDSLDEDLNFE